MKKISRRDLLGGIATAGASVVTLDAFAADRVQTSNLAFTGKHQPKPLPFNPAKLAGISEKVVRSHPE